MKPAYRFPRIVYTVAAVYGFLVITPQYWMEQRIGQDSPPAITHPEYFYGFIGLCIAWQLVFLVVARDPVRYRPIMLVSIVEKLAFSVPAVLLFAQHRIAVTTFAFGLVDLALGALFAVAYFTTAAAHRAEVG